MIVHSLHPIDTILADVGMMARRAQHGTLIDPEFREIEKRIRQAVADQGADPAGLVGAILDSLVLAADARALEHAHVLAAMTRIRLRLVRVRDGSLPVVPNFAVVPSGVHGRPLARLTVIDGGRPHNTPTH